MNPLETLIDQHYIGTEKEELLELLTEFGVLSPLEHLLRHKGDLVDGENLHQTAAQILAVVNNQMAKYKDEPDKKLGVERALGGFAMNIFREILEKMPHLYQLQVIGNVKQQLKTTCRLWNWNYIALNEVFSIEKLEESKGREPNIPLDFKEISKAGKKLKLTWTEKGDLVKLSELLFGEKYITDKQVFIDFVENPDHNVKIIWAESKKYHLVYLMNQLIYKDYLRVSPSKGFYVYTESHILYDTNKGVWLPFDVKKVS